MRQIGLKNVFIRVTLAVSLLGMLGSFSLEVLGNQPCIYCWILRVLVIIVFLASLVGLKARSKRNVVKAIGVSSVIGVLVSGYLIHVESSSVDSWLCTIIKSTCSNSPIIFGFTPSVYALGMFLFILGLSMLGMMPTNPSVMKRVLRMKPWAIILMLVILTGILAASLVDYARVSDNFEGPYMSSFHSLGSKIDPVMDSGKMAFVYFYTEWCHFCQQETPIIDELELLYSDNVTFVRVNGDENGELLRELGVSGYPTMFLISEKNTNGYMYKDFRGFKEKSLLKNSIDGMLAGPLQTNYMPAHTQLFLQSFKVIGPPMLTVIMLFYFVVSSAKEKIFRSKLSKRSGLLTTLLVTLFMSSFTANYWLSPAYCTPGTAYLEVSATSPHVADMTDSSQVTIQAKDSCRRPLSGAGIKVYVFGNKNHETLEVYSTIDHGNGTYTTSIVSRYSDTVKVLAIDTLTEVYGFTYVEFQPSSASRLLMTAEKVQPSIPKSLNNRTASIFAWVEDAFNNVLLPPRSNVSFSTDLGLIETLGPDEFGVFEAQLTYGGLGYANVTATDQVSGLFSTIEVIFPAKSASIVKPAEGVTNSSIFTMPVNVYVADPSRALGHYEVTISFNSSVIRFVNATDGDPFDEFDPPRVNITSPDTVVIAQDNLVNISTPTGSIDIANLTFQSIGFGWSAFDMTGLLSDTHGASLPETPDVPPTNQTSKPNRYLCLKFITVGRAKSTVKWGQIMDAVQTINKALKKCSKWTKANTQEFYNIIKKIKLAIVEDPTGEFNINRRQDWTKDDYKKVRDLLAKENDPNCINVYLVNTFPDVGGGQTFHPSRTAQGWGRGGIVSEANAVGWVMAHEIGHYLLDKSFTEKPSHHAGKTNKDLMHPSGAKDKGGGTDLSKEECKNIMGNPILKATDPGGAGVEIKDPPSPFTGVSVSIGAFSPTDHTSRPGLIGPNVMLQINVTTGQNITIHRISIQSWGSGDDHHAIYEVSLIWDVDRDGQYDTGEPLLSEGFYASDNGLLEIQIPPQGSHFGHFTPSGEHDSLLVVYYMTPCENFYPAIGHTFAFDIVDMYVREFPTQEPITVQGLPLTSATKTITSGVGGIVIPVDKLALLAPYIALAIAVVAITIGAVYARKRWFRKAVIQRQ